jgi:hypothetical protein
MSRGIVAPGLANSGWWPKLKYRGAAPVHGDCWRRWPNPASRRPEAGGGGDEEIPHVAASWIWRSERSGSHWGRRSTAVAGRRGMAADAWAGGRGARRLVGELHGAVPELREVRLGLGTTCSSGALSSSSGTPSGRRLGSRMAPDRRWLKAWRGDGGGWLLLLIRKLHDAHGLPTRARAPTVFPFLLLEDQHPRPCSGKQHKAWSKQAAAIEARQNYGSSSKTMQQAVQQSRGRAKWGPSRLRSKFTHEAPQQQSWTRQGKQMGLRETAALV